MKFYDNTHAPNARRVRMFMAEKGMTIPTVAIDLAGKEHFGDAFTAINPRQRIPVLETDDGQVIGESIAICRYLEAIQPEPNLFGRTAAEIGEIEMRNRQLEFEFYMRIAAVFRHSHPGMADREVPQVQAWAEANRPKVDAELAALDRHLKGKDFFAAGRFTVADITALIAVDFMRVIKLRIPETMVDLTRWRNAMLARPSASA